jgi:hypothetical protein
MISLGLFGIKKCHQSLNMIMRLQRRELTKCLIFMNHKYSITLCRISRIVIRKLSNYQLQDQDRKYQI